MVVLLFWELFLPRRESKRKVSKSVPARRVSKGDLLRENLFWHFFLCRAKRGKSSFRPFYGLLRESSGTGGDRLFRGEDTRFYQGRYSGAACIRIPMLLLTLIRTVAVSFSSLFDCVALSHIFRVAQRSAVRPEGRYYLLRACRFSFVLLYLFPNVALSLSSCFRTGHQ